MISNQKLFKNGREYWYKPTCLLRCLNDIQKGMRKSGRKMKKKN